MAAPSAIGMLTALRQKTQVSTVGIIHQKRNAKILAHPASAAISCTPPR